MATTKQAHTTEQPGQNGGGVVRFLDPFRDPLPLERLTERERTLLRTVNQKIAARPSLRAIIDYLFDTTQELIPCDRIGLAFVDERGDEVRSYYNRASYAPLLIDHGYREPLHGSSLEHVLRSGRLRVIDDLERYLAARPRSRSTRLLVREGVRSSLTCPLTVEGRVVGFIFRSSRRPAAFTTRHLELQLAITERLSQAVEKAWRIEQLEELNHAYTQMLGFVSHELKSPVASLVTDAELLAGGYLGDLTPEQREKVAGMARKGRYLLGLVQEYLDLALVEGGRLRLVRQPRVDVRSEVVDEAVALVAPRLEERGMRLEVVGEGDERPLVCCDPGLLRIVLVNLLDNAVKYGREGGLVRVTTALLGEGGEPRLRVSVWNEGPGFGPSARARLFRRFSRLDEPELKARKGTGLGLYNAWRIITMHRGRIWADSRKGEWAEFTFEIPGAAGCGPDDRPSDESEQQ